MKSLSEDMSYCLRLNNADRAKGVLQTRPPTNPSAANAHIGSEPVPPKAGPKTGISSVR